MIELATWSSGRVPPMAGIWEIEDLRGLFKPKPFYGSVHKCILETIQTFHYSRVIFAIAHWNK